MQHTENILAGRTEVLLRDGIISGKVYYTPDYIVKYIVEQTVGPMLREAVAGKATDAEIVQAVMEVNVLDPAMGSGHFLVEATEYIARFLVDLGVAPDGNTPDEADLAYWKRRVAHACIYGVDLNPLAVELAKLSLWLITVAKDRPLSFLDHHLRPGNSLVGARLSALQQHGAASVKKKKGPKRGTGVPAVCQTSAVHGRGAEAGSAHGRDAHATGDGSAHGRDAHATGDGSSHGRDGHATLSLFTNADFTQRMAVAVGSMWLIEGVEATTVAQVKEQEYLYDDLRRQLVGKYGKLANLLCAQAFGVTVPPDLWQATVDYAMGRSMAALPQIAAIVEQVETIAARERFFHWELEFPELFFDRHGRSLGEDGGFEAVVGNPPYVRQEQLAGYKGYFQQDYADVYHGVADLFVYFFAQGLQQAKRGGRLSYINSNSWLRANYATPLRSYLRTNCIVDTLVDCGDNRVFAEAPDVYPAVHVVRNAIPSDNHIAQAAVFTRGEGLTRFASQVSEKLFPVSMHDQDDSGWQLSSDEGRAVFAKLMATGKPLGEVVGGHLYRGILTGMNDAFIIDQLTRSQLIETDPTCAPLLKKIVNGEDVRNWYIEDEDRWLIFTRRGIDIDAYPAVKAYLEQFRERLEPKPDGWSDNQPWPGRKPGQYQWYEIQDTVAYYEAFEQPKIFWPEMAKSPRYALVDPGVVCNKTAFMLPQSDGYLLGTLMSRVIWYATSWLCVPIGERKGLLRYTLSSQFITRLPIPDAAPADREAIGALAMEITTLAKTRYALHQRVRRRVQSDFGTQGKTLNQKLTAWWALDFSGLRAELKKVFKAEIAVRERDEWEVWFAEQCAEHQRLTGAIIAGETALNARVYALFDLTPEEIALIEASTKYRYGEV